MFLVTIVSANKNDKIHVEEYTCNNMVDVSRILITHKPKRNYRFVSSTIDNMEGILNV